MWIIQANCRQPITAQKSWQTMEQNIKQLNCKAQMVALDPKWNHKTNISKDKRIITNKLSGQQEDIKIQSNYKDGYWYLITRKSDKKTTFQMKIRGKKMKIRWRPDDSSGVRVGRQQFGNNW